MKKILLTLVLAGSLLSVSCAKEKTATTETPTSPVITDPTLPSIPEGTGGINSPYGASVSFELIGSTESEKLSLLNQYLGNTNPVNDPTNFNIHVDFEELPGGTYAGEVSISFMDRGLLHQDTFRTGNGSSKTRFNKWISNDNGFHAILDDGKFGALVFVIDEVVNLGDGAGVENTVNGTIFYMNYPVVLGFGREPEQHPQQLGGDGVCWDITRGLYQCLPWDSVSHADSAIYPPKLFKVLGKFKGLNVSKAFNY